VSFLLCDLIRYCLLIYLWSLLLGDCKRWLQCVLPCYFVHANHVYANTHLLPIDCISASDAGFVSASDTDTFGYDLIVSDGVHKVCRHRSLHHYWVQLFGLCSPYASFRSFFSPHPHVSLLLNSIYQVKITTVATLYSKIRLGELVPLSIIRVSILCFGCHSPLWLVVPPLSTDSTSLSLSPPLHIGSSKTLSSDLTRQTYPPPSLWLP